MDLPVGESFSFCFALHTRHFSASNFVVTAFPKLRSTVYLWRSDLSPELVFTDKKYFVKSKKIQQATVNSNIQ
jgi:hypothetical protein